MEGGQGRGGWEGRRGGNTRTGEERRLEKENEYSAGASSKSAPTRDEKVFSVEITRSGV